ncbi:MAG: hemN [Chlamydiia bacterium]|nr:hemN [Chlamydiia bacterium]
MVTVTIEELLQLNKPIPRYTSYPTAPEWTDFSSASYESALKNLSEPLSLYVHIPFCKTMCLYCACSVVLNRRPENEEKYVSYLLKEIELVAQLSGRKKVTQLHFGGGTPTQLTEDQITRIMHKLQESFDIDPQGEIAIEIDPRTVMDGKKLACLRRLGFNRVSFGVQDTDPKVQEAVKRRQSYEMTKSAYLQARALGFSGISIDLIYGLPYQTVETFRETALRIIELRPDRISLFSYAKVPWLKAHQKAIPEHTLPTTDEKFQIYLLARSLFIEAGYRAIGMDHFSVTGDELDLAYGTKNLKRNFQGYSVCKADNMLGFGVTAIGYADNAYVQNIKDLTLYYQAIDERALPVHRGRVLTDDDVMRKYVIYEIMCAFSLDKKIFEKKFHCSFDQLFLQERERLEKLPDLVIDTKEFIKVTPKGELFIRNIASCFDRYLHEPGVTRKFSQSV